MIEQARHPRDCGPDMRKAELALPRIGYFIDWLDARPEERKEDDKALWRLTTNPVVAIASALVGRLPPENIAGEYMVVMIPWVDWDHMQEYSPDYHARIAGHLAADEIAAAEATYSRLLELEPTCISALANMAELERRAGDLPRAERLLRQALEVARAGGHRHRVANERWTVHLRCAAARLGSETGDRIEEVLGILNEGGVPAIGKQLEQMHRGCYDGHDRADAERRAEDFKVSLHAAFWRADRERRIVLAAAMRRAAIRPDPPPAAHEAAGDAAEVHRRLVASDEDAT